jgi:hypothetical protein
VKYYLAIDIDNHNNACIIKGIYDTYDKALSAVYPCTWKGTACSIHEIELNKQTLLDPMADNYISHTKYKELT